MEIKLKNFIEPGKIVSFLNFSGSFQKFKSNKKVCYVLDTPFTKNIKVGNYFRKYFSNYTESKFRDACRIALLDPIVVDTNLKNLSKTEIKKVRFVEGLMYQSDTFVFVNFEKGFYEKNRAYYRKLFLKLTKYNKCILLVTNDVSFLLGMKSQCFLFTEQCYEQIQDFYDDNLYHYVQMPQIISFVKFLNKRGIVMNHYVDQKELLKAIYRSVS